MVNDFVSKEDLPFFTSGSKIALASLFLKEGMKDVYATFDLLIRELPKSRNFFVFVGLEHVAHYLRNFKFSDEQLKWLKAQFKFSPDEMKYFKNFKFSGDMWALPEGSFFFPSEPVIRITAPIIEAQIIEMYLINTVYLQTALASKLARFTFAAKGKEVGIGYNRCYGTDAAMKSSRINEILGNPNSLILYHSKYGSQAFGSGTFHYLIMAFDNETDAFKAYLKHMKGRGYVLIDTYDSIHGIKNFIKAAKDVEKEGIKATGIQLDSGDLYELSVTARKMLDNAGLSYVKIFAMSNLDEWKVADLEKRHAPIDFYAGVTELLTPSDAPTLELVYKLSEIKKGASIFPKMKTSTQKVSLPGRKQVFRESRNGKYVGDVIGMEQEQREGAKMLTPIIQNGEVVYKFPSIEKIRKYFYAEKEKFDPAVFDINTKYDYPVSVSDELQKLAKQTREEIERTHHYDTDF